MSTYTAPQLVRTPFNVGSWHPGGSLPVITSKGVNVTDQDTLNQLVQLAQNTHIPLLVGSTNLALPNTTQNDALGICNLALNQSGAADAVANGVSFNPEGLVVWVEPTDCSVELCAEVTYTQTTAGTGTISISLVDYTASAFLDTQFSTLSNVVGRLQTAKIRSVLPAGSVPSNHAIGVILGVNGDAGQTPAISIGNASNAPSRLTAERK